MTLTTGGSRHISPISLIDATIPPPTDKHARYRQSVKGKGRDDRWNEARQDKRLEAYLSREFVAWDGEGINLPDGSHSYVLLASSDGPSLVSESGIPTLEAFNLFLASRPDVVHVVYGGSYDINMILRDVPKELLWILYSAGAVNWGPYWLEWRGGKSFRVKLGKRCFTLYDVLPFFQRSFVSACDEYLGTEWESRDQIIAEKKRRGNFTFQEIGAISEYNGAELRNLIRLCDELKGRLFKVGIRVSRWDGPGAIASALYQKHQTKQALNSVPTDVAERGRYGYAGGRFEIIRQGHSTRGAWQYDIRSAYPAAIRNLPCLTHGEWRYVIAPSHVAGFGIYGIDVTTPPTVSPTQPQPLWQRNKDGTVWFRDAPKGGQYWSPEAQVALEAGIPIIDGWEYETSCECNPFAFVEPMYNKRAALKKAGDGAHIGLKLGLNSLYGKLAQQIGWNPGPPLRIPPYHCLEWAGYVTSHCRAQVYRAALLAPDDIIAFETDAVFSRVPLDLPLGTRLGEWDKTEYQSLTYLKSGMYFGTLADGTEVEKCRGINKGTLTREAVIEGLERAHTAPYPSVTWDAEQTRFIGIGQAFAQSWELWTHWVTAPRVINQRLNGKRTNVWDADQYHAMQDDGWYETVEGLGNSDDHSYPYEVEWINPSPEQHAPDGRSLMEVRKSQGMAVPDDI